MRSVVRSTACVSSRSISAVITVAPSPAAASWSDAAVSVTSWTTRGSTSRRRSPERRARPYCVLSGGRIQSRSRSSSTSAVRRPRAEAGAADARRDRDRELLRLQPRPGDGPVAGDGCVDVVEPEGDVDLAVPDAAETESRSTSRELTPTSGKARPAAPTIGASRVAAVLPQVPTTSGPATVSWAAPGGADGADLGRQQLLGVLGHHPAGVGQHQVAAGPLDQGDAQRRLERGEVLRDRPGRVAEVLGRGGQGAAAGQLAQGAELGQVQPRAVRHRATSRACSSGRTCDTSAI